MSVNSRYLNMVLPHTNDNYDIGILNANTRTLDRTISNLAYNQIATALFSVYEGKSIDTRGLLVEGFTSEYSMVNMANSQNILLDINSKKIDALGHTELQTNDSSSVTSISTQVFAYQLHTRAAANRVKITVYLRSSSGTFTSIQAKLSSLNAETIYASSYDTIYPSDLNESWTPFTFEFSHNFEANTDYYLAFTISGIVGSALTIRRCTGPNADLRLFTGSATSWTQSSTAYPYYICEFYSSEATADIVTHPYELEDTTESVLLFMRHEYDATLRVAPRIIFGEGAPVYADLISTSRGKTQAGKSCLVGCYKAKSPMPVNTITLGVELTRIGGPGIPYSLYDYGILL